MDNMDNTVVMAINIQVLAIQVIIVEVIIIILVIQIIIHQQEGIIMVVTFGMLDKNKI
jgi:hypothetical protein